MPNLVHDAAGEGIYEQGRVGGDDDKPIADERSDMSALVIVAHGSHLNPNASDPAYAHADAIRDAGYFEAVRVAFWKEEPHVREVLRTVEENEVFVVPLFISEGYFTERVIPRELRLGGWDRTLWESDGTDASAVTVTAADVDSTVHYCGPVGTHDAMSAVIVERAESVTGDRTVGAGVGLAVVGHGTERNEHSARAIEYHTTRIRDRNRFDEVLAVFMDEEPAVENVTDHFGSEDIVVVPLFVADGYHTQEDIPEAVGITEDHRTGWSVPTAVDGHQIWYAGAVGTESLLADVIVERAVDAGADVPAEYEFGALGAQASSRSDRLDIGSHNRPLTGD